MTVGPERRILWFSILELIILSSMIALTLSIWTVEPYRGWITTVVMLAVCVRWINCRHLPERLPALAFEVPIAGIALFLLALLIGMHLPPFMAAPDYEWPPFNGLSERVVHAGILSLWTIPWGIPTLIFCSFIELITRSVAQRRVKLPLRRTMRCTEDA